MMFLLLLPLFSFSSGHHRHRRITTTSWLAAAAAVITLSLLTSWIAIFNLLAASLDTMHLFKSIHSTTLHLDSTSLSLSVSRTDNSFAASVTLLLLLFLLLLLADNQVRRLVGLSHSLLLCCLSIYLSGRILSSKTIWDTARGERKRLVERWWPKKCLRLHLHTLMTEMMDSPRIHSTDGCTICTAQAAQTQQHSIGDSYNVH